MSTTLTASIKTIKYLATRKATKNTSVFAVRNKQILVDLFGAKAVKKCNQYGYFNTELKLHGIDFKPEYYFVDTAIIDNDQLLQDYNDDLIACFTGATIILYQTKVTGFRINDLVTVEYPELLAKYLQWDNNKSYVILQKSTDALTLVDVKEVYNTDSLLVTLRRDMDKLCRAGKAEAIIDLPGVYHIQPDDLIAITAIGTYLSRKQFCHIK